MKLIRLNNIFENYFEKAWELYEDAFPIEERRILEDQTTVLKNNNYHFNVLIDKNQFIGFILWWDFETSVQYRNISIKKILYQLE